MNELLATLAIVGLLAGSAYVVYHQPADQARRALREALERGAIRPEEYAAHIRALDDAA